MCKKVRNFLNFFVSQPFWKTPFSGCASYIEIFNRIFVGQFFGVFELLVKLEIDQPFPQFGKQYQTRKYSFCRLLKRFSAEYSYSLPKKTKRVTNFLVCREPSKNVAARLSASVLFSNMLKVSRMQSNRRRNLSTTKKREDQRVLHEQASSRACALG